MKPVIYSAVEILEGGWLSENNQTPVRSAWRLIKDQIIEAITCETLRCFCCSVYCMKFVILKQSDTSFP